MKQTILAVVLVFTMSAALHAQTSTQSKNAEEAVTTILQQMADAFMKSDVSFLEKYFADTYIFTDPAGMVHNKANMIDYMKGGNFKFESVIPDDKKITVYENMAVVTQHTTEKHVGDDDISGEYRWTFIFFKQDSDWQIVAAQGTRVMKNK